MENRSGLVTIESNRIDRPFYLFRREPDHLLGPSGKVEEAL